VKSEEYTPFGHKLNKKFLRGRPSVSEKTSGCFLKPIKCFGLMMPFLLTRLEWFTDSYFGPYPLYFKWQLTDLCSTYGHTPSF